MNYKVSIKHSTEKSLNSLIDKIHDKIIEKILTLSENSRPKQSKKLESKEYYRIRSGDYRILYIIDDTIKTIEIIAVDHRKDIYKKR